jgi:hypothetical protein
VNYINWLALLVYPTVLTFAQVHRDFTTDIPELLPLGLGLLATPVSLLLIKNFQVNPLDQSLSISASRAGMIFISLLIHGVFDYYYRRERLFAEESARALGPRICGDGFH